MNSEYLSIFLDEALEHVRIWSDALMKLEGDASPSLFQDVFRAAHTIKGMAMTMDFQTLGDLTHRAESLLAQLRDGRLPLTAASVDLLSKTLNTIELFLDEIERTGHEPQTDFSTLLAALEDAATVADGDPAERAPAPRSVDAAQATKADGGSSPDLVAFAESRVRDCLLGGLRVYDLILGFSSACRMPMARIVQWKQGVQPESVLYIIPPLDSLATLDSSSTVRVGLAVQAETDDVYGSVDSVSELFVQTLCVWQIGADETLSLAPVDKTPADSGSLSASDILRASRSAPDERKTAARRSARVDSAKLDDLFNLMTEFTVARTHLDRRARRLHDADLSTSVDAIDRLTRQLQALVMSMRMVPVESVFHRYPRMVRDTARRLKKQVDMTMFGMETELDRTVVEEIGDVLVHLLRNALDHGIESPAVRTTRGKPAHGSIVLRVSAESGHARIEVADDGDGIDRAGVLAKARALGLAPVDTPLSAAQVDQFLFAPGFSTALEVSELSGRGVGLDAVKTRVKSLGGRIDMVSEPGKGTNFILRLPINLSLIKGLLVRIGSDSYVIPQAGVAGVVALPPPSDGRPPATVSWNDTRFALIRIPGAPAVQSAQYGVILQSGGRRAALCVNALLGLQEVIVKPLDKRFRDIHQLAGGTILADGEVALIVDPGALLDS